MSWPKGRPGIVRPCSDETRAKLSEIAKRRRLSPETREKIGAAQRGRPKSPEHRARIIAANVGKARAFGNHNTLGHTLTEEHRAAISAGLRGNHNASGKHVGNRFVLDAPVKGECVYCFGPATTRDHVIPRGRPGWDDPENVVLACLWCNTSKKDRTPDEWLEAM